MPREHEFAKIYLSWLLTGSLWATSLFAQAGMVLIPAKDASFQMGSELETPVHTVRFTRNFRIDTTEVTQLAYQTLMQRTYGRYSALEWGHPYGVGDNYPAYLLEWSDAALYCNARSKAEGRDTVYVYSGISGYPGNGGTLVNLSVNFTASGYRLPSEAEWEFAYRAGTTTDFFWNKDFDPYPETSADTAGMHDYAIWQANSWIQSADNPAFGTHPVASKLPNAWGLYDMAGNVSEWVNDWYADYATDEVTDPTGSDIETFRFVRGGNWGNTAYYLRASCREFASPDYYIYFIGFRTVLPVAVSSVDDNLIDSNLPAQFVLEQNYPNPFNPTTTIHFQLPQTANVSLAIFNIKGQIVSELLKNQMLDAGQHSIVFDASDLSAGVYFYQITAIDFRQTKRMLLVK